MKRLLSNLHTLKFKIIAMLITISLLPVLITGIGSYYSSENVLKKKLETTSSQTIEEITRGLDNYFTAMSKLVQVMSNDINVVAANNPTYFEFAKSLIANVKATDHNIINVFVGTESGMFYTDPKAELPEGFDHRQRDWYKDAVKNSGQMIITDPYIDTASKLIVISIATTIMDGDQLIGVVGMDINLSEFSNSLSDITVGDSGYVFISDKNGVIISHPDQSLIGTDEAAKLSFWDQAQNNLHGFSTFEFKNESKFAAYGTSELLGWKVVASMPYAELSKDTQIIKTGLFYIIIIILIVAVITAVLFSLPISRNIKGLLNAFDKVSHGDMTTAVKVKSKDEFNLLGEHFNGMVSNVSDLLRNVNQASNTVLDTSAILAKMAEETNSSVNEVARAVEEVANGATEQAQNASDGAYSVSELAAKMNIIEESTTHIDDLSKNATNLTKQGLGSVESLIIKSNHTASSTARVSELVYDTSESVNQINAISDTIDLITEQTNLLALNASIEAARAGESGKGFAVVANEIRKLAEQSKASTVKIKAIVDDISKKTALSVVAMEDTDKNVKEQSVLVDQTQTVFREIKKAVDELSEMVAEIKNNTNVVAAQKENIVSQIENISAISEESASATEEVTASTEEIAVTMDEITKHTIDLQKLSETLQEKMNTFKFN
jgi:methyl-accepting chemotaxis protein